MRKKWREDGWWGMSVKIAVWVQILFLPSKLWGIVGDEHFFSLP
jgi:hypothetical protein